ncbi:MAG: hypothetical protein ABI461_10300 [Polyangiaceae bacterium]
MTAFPDKTRLTSSSSLSGFARDAVREKATRELTSLRAVVDAFDHLLAVKIALTTATSDAGALLVGLGSITTDAGTVTRAKKLRKLVDDAREAADALVETTALETRRAEAEEKMRMLFEELTHAGIVLDEQDAAHDVAAE